jgi:hypothetical protein
MLTTRSRIMRKRRSTVLIPLLTGLVMLALLASQAAVAQTPFPTATLLPTFTIPPTSFPTSLPTAVIRTPGVCPTPLPIVPGAIIAVSSGVLLRYQPDTSAPILTYFGTAREMRVIGGPTCADGYNWWQVESRWGPGWVAEGRPERPPGYFIRLLILPEGESCGEPLDFTIGETVELAVGIRVHQEANLDALVLHVAPFETEVLIVGGPVCGNGYNWWQVQVPYSGLLIQGWIAQGPEGVTWLLPSIEPTPVCAPPIRRLGIGGIGYVNYRDRIPKNLRDAPGLDAPVLYTLVDGVSFEVIGGPVCHDSINWWHIRIRGREDVTGWFAEGGPGAYWIRVGDPFVPMTATP